MKLVLCLATLVATTTCFSLSNPLLQLPLHSLDDPIPGDSPVEVCDVEEPQLLQIHTMTTSPNPPERGQNLTIDGFADLSKRVEEGAYVDVDVTYGYIKLIHTTYDLCDKASTISMECPLEKGPYKLQKQVAIPDQVPPGKYVVTARAYTKEDELITCLSAEVVFPPYGSID